MTALLHIMHLGAAMPAWVPFKTPMNALQDWWYLLIIPLAFGISMTYKAMRLEDMSRIWHQTLLMTVQVMLAIIGLALALGLFIAWIIPHLPVR